MGSILSLHPPWKSLCQRPSSPAQFSPPNYVLSGEGADDRIEAARGLVLIALSRLICFVCPRAASPETRKGLLPLPRPGAGDQHRCIALRLPPGHFTALPSSQPRAAGPRCAGGRDTARTSTRGIQMPLNAGGGFKQEEKPPPSPAFLCRLFLGEKKMRQL